MREEAARPRSGGGLSGMAYIEALYNSVSCPAGARCHPCRHESRFGYVYWSKHESRALLTAITPRRLASAIRRGRY